MQPIRPGRTRHRPRPHPPSRPLPAITFGRVVTLLAPAIRGRNAHEAVLLGVLARYEPYRVSTSSILSATRTLSLSLRPIPRRLRPRPARPAVSPATSPRCHSRRDERPHSAGPVRRERSSRVSRPPPRPVHPRLSLPPSSLPRPRSSPSAARIAFLASRVSFRLCQQHARACSRGVSGFYLEMVRVPASREFRTVFTVSPLASVHRAVSPSTTGRSQGLSSCSFPFVLRSFTGP